jgi:hypothetical protein
MRGAISAFNRIVSERSCLPYWGGPTRDKAASGMLSFDTPTSRAVEAT